MLIFWFSAYVLASTLAFVAALTKVGVAPAKPLCDCAAVAAFVLYKFGPVFGAASAAAARGGGGALAAHELLGLEAGKVRDSVAVLHASKVGLATRIALVIAKL